MKTSSAKAKGRSLQQWTRDRILHAFPELTKDDVRSCSMGSQGEDIQLSPLARSLFPFSIECKCQEKVNIWDAYKQATANAVINNTNPLVIIKKNGVKQLAILDAEVLIELVRSQTRVYENT